MGDEGAGDEMEQKGEMRAVKVIGRGAMGTVFLVRNEGFDTPLALKAMSKRVLEKKSDAVKRCDTERKILADIRTHPHPFLPTLLAHVETERVIGWVMEYCPGGDLNALRLSQSEKMFSESIIRFYAAEIVLALEHLHGLGIVYRDLKPENILVQGDGHIMLTDFDLSTKLPPKRPATVVEIEDPLHFRHSKRAGLLTSMMKPCVCSSVTLQTKSTRSQVRRSNSAKVSPINRTRKPGSASSSNENFRSNSFVGTEEYVSPEMVKGTGHDYAVDWWALGILLYEMLNGRTPFKGATRKETFYNILVQQPVFAGPWTPLRYLILQLLEKDPSTRLGSCNGAIDIKHHLFFRGLDWDAVQHVSRPPFVPSLQPYDELSNSTLSLDIDEYLNKQFEALDSTDDITRLGNASERHEVDGNGQIWMDRLSKAQETEDFGLF